jgi:hypothetical protein
VAIPSLAGNLYRRVKSPKRVRASAYAYASEGEYSPEVEKLHRINRFGLEAITGRRQFYYAEYLALLTAENIVIAYQSRKAAENWAVWYADNPRLAQILLDIENE